MSSSLQEKLHEVLYPGEAFTEGRTAALAAKLRQVADELQATSNKHQQLERKPAKELDFTLYQQRYVALQLLYLGHDYDGFARQDSTTKTIEEELFAALRKTRLVPSDATWRDLNYSRGGRTDKGVSALGQVVALFLRSKGRAGQDAVSEGEEFDFPYLLNCALPPAIRVLGWTTAPADFSARFSAKFREYKYFIVDNEERLDLERMQVAAGYLEGEHDFRNFCKADVDAVKTFVRTIQQAQVRCMASVLLMVGRGHEEPSIVHTLLDLGQMPQKPQYTMASEEPLLLYSCNYGDLMFRRSKRVYHEVLKGMDEVVTSHLIRAAMIQSIESKMEADVEEVIDRKRLHAGKHIPLLQRAREPSVEERMQRRAARPQVNLATV